MTVIIDPRAQISYSSFYIEGIYSLAGKSNVSFSSKYFKDLLQEDGINDFDQYFAFVGIDNSSYKKIIIDFRDKNTININALNWSDIYGKVNFNKTEILNLNLGSEVQKITPIGPNFGVRLWNNFKTYTYLLHNYLVTRKNLPVDLRTFFSGYNWQRKREYYKFYQNNDLSGNSIFFISLLYDDKQNYRTNYNRAQYIRACKKKATEFEGGLFVKDKKKDYGEFTDVITYKYVRPEIYLEKIKKSAVVFNTPAVWGCHGWKLGEFLALGKAIISTPLNNDMPYPLTHGQNIHFVESENEIEIALEKILKDHHYKKQLENGARIYFDQFLKPEIVIERLIKRIPL